MEITTNSHPHPQYCMCFSKKCTLNFSWSKNFFLAWITFNKTKNICFKYRYPWTNKKKKWHSFDEIYTVHTSVTENFRFATIVFFLFFIFWAWKRNRSKEWIISDVTLFGAARMTSFVNNGYLRLQPNLNLRVEDILTKQCWETWLFERDALGKASLSFDTLVQMNLWPCSADACHVSASSAIQWLADCTVLHWTVEILSRLTLDSSDFYLFENCVGNTNAFKYGREAISMVLPT